MTNHIYVHIPFCDAICSYCDFCRYIANKEMQKQWQKVLLTQMEERTLDGISTLYFGGGTPSSLSLDLLKPIAERFIPSLRSNYEWTIEANPESLNREKLSAYRSWGINRISLGVQTFQDPLLRLLGRRHDADRAKEVISWIKEYGFTNVSIDLMYGLPNQTLEDVKKDIETFLSLDLPHLSIYSLQIEENSVFGRQKLEPCPEDLEADMYESIENVLTKNGFEHYEISSYARDHFYSKHNLSYWNDSDFIGFGCGASGREGGIRYDNTFNLKEFCEGDHSLRWITTNPKDQAFEAIMMGLRTSFGLDLMYWNQKYHRDFLKDYRELLTKHASLLTVQNGHLRCTKRGMECLNSILIDFLEDV